MKYFTIDELTSSATASRYGIVNIPNAEQVRNLEYLATEVLDKARERLGMPIYVNSGYRCRKLNSQVGGAAKSYHMQGRAADLDTRNGNNRRLYEILRTLPHTELLWEQGGRWIHVAL